MALKRTTRTDASFSMSSMTDIVFLLLLFFLVTSTLINPNALKLLLPKSSGQVNTTKPMASVSLVPREDGSGYVYCINGEADHMLTYDQLVSELQVRLGGDEDATFSIYTDESTPVGEVVAVMNIGKKLDYKVILATRPE